MKRAKRARATRHGLSQSEWDKKIRWVCQQIEAKAEEEARRLLRERDELVFVREYTVAAHFRSYRAHRRSWRPRVIQGGRR